MEALGREFQAFHKAQEAGEKPDINDYPQLGKLSAMAREAESTRSRDIERDSQNLDLPPLADLNLPEKGKGVQTAAAAAPLILAVPGAMEALGGLIGGTVIGKVGMDYARQHGWLGRTEQVDPPPPTPGFPADPPAGMDARPQGRPATPEEAPKPLENIPPRIDPKSGILINPDQSGEFDKPFILEAVTRPRNEWRNLAQGDPIFSEAEEVRRGFSPETTQGVDEFALGKGYMVGASKTHVEVKMDGTSGDLAKDFNAWRTKAGVSPRDVGHFTTVDRKTGQALGTGQWFKLPDGTKVTWRSYSDEGNPTLQIERGPVKIEKRYIPGWNP